MKKSTNSKPRRKPQADSLPIKRYSLRGDGEDLLQDVDILQRTVNRLRGCGLIPKGVYRFHSHEEADIWMTRQIAATHARHKSKR